MARRAMNQPRCPRCQKFVKREAEACRSCGNHLSVPIEEAHPAQPEALTFSLRSIFPMMDYQGNPLPVAARLMTNPGTQ